AGGSCRNHTQSGSSAPDQYAASSAPEKPTRASFLKSRWTCVPASPGRVLHSPPPERLTTNEKLPNSSSLGTVPLPRLLRRDACGRTAGRLRPSGRVRRPRLRVPAPHDGEQALGELAAQAPLRALEELVQVPVAAPRRHQHGGVVAPLALVPDALQAHVQDVHVAHEQRLGARARLVRLPQPPQAGGGVRQELLDGLPLPRGL